MKDDSGSSPHGGSDCMYLLLATAGRARLRRGDAGPATCAGVPTESPPREPTCSTLPPYGAAKQDGAIHQDDKSASVFPTQLHVCDRDTNLAAGHLQTGP